MSTTAAENATARDKRMAKLIVDGLRELAYEIWMPADEATAEPEPVREWDDVILGTADPASDYAYTVSGANVPPQAVFCRLTTSGIVAERTVAIEYQL